MPEKVIELTLQVKPEVFVNNEGEQVRYYSCTVEVLGEKIRFAPKTDDKKLFVHLVKQLED